MAAHRLKFILSLTKDFCFFSVIAKEVWYSLQLLYNRNEKIAPLKLGCMRFVLKYNRL